MPKRDFEQQEETVGGKYAHIVDLDFLPREIIERVDDIFDSYFHLGMKEGGYKMKGEHSPQFVANVSSLTSPQLGDKLGEYTAWYSYASDKAKYVIVACNHVESEMERAMDREVGQQVQDKGNIDAKKAKARSSQEYMMLGSYHQKLVGLKIMLEKELQIYDKCIASLSREVSRREHNGGF